MGTPDRSNPLVRRAIELGYEVYPGKRHWHARHSLTQAVEIFPFGRRMSDRAMRNILASLKRSARPAI